MICRPTLRALAMLPDDTFDVASARSALARAKATSDPAERLDILTGLRLDDLDHPLLADARARFADGGKPDVHKSGTKAAGSPIYEVRDPQGAGWRGAVSIEHAIGWLVFADRHDRFHATVAAYLSKATAQWRPGELDRQLADREAAARRLDRWKCETLSAFLDLLGNAALTGPSSSTLTIADEEGNRCAVSLEVIHDAPATVPADAHTTSSLLQVNVTFRADAYDVVRQLAALVSLLHDASAPLEQAFLPDGGLMLLMTLTHARLAQLTTTLADSGGTRPPDVVEAPTVLHAVGKPDLVEGLVLGRAARALCGAWFVPRFDATCELPVCETCEASQPLAQAVLDRLRAQS